MGDFLIFIPEFLNNGNSGFQNHGFVLMFPQMNF